MAPAISAKEATLVTTAVVAAGAVIAVGVLNKEKTKELASAAAARSSEALKAVQSSASSSYNSVASFSTSSYNSLVSSLNSTWESVKGYTSRRKYKRVKSFPLIADVDELLADVDAAAGQRKPKKSPSKKAGKAAAALEKGVDLVVSAK